jgi:ribose 5-phosphate isomerase A
VPIVVLAFAHPATGGALERLGMVELRMRNGSPWITDSGNFIYDLRAGVLGDPGGLEAELGRMPGVVETGLFVGRADVVLVAGPDGVRRLERSPHR